MSREETEERRNLTLIWRIENLSYWEPGFHGREIRSACFYPLWMDGKGIYLRIFPKGKDRNDPHLQVWLRSFYLGNKCSIDCEWSLLDDVGSPLVTETVRNQNLTISEPVGMPSRLTHEEVFVTKKSTFLPLDTLTVRCRIWNSRGDLEQAEHISFYTRIITKEQSFLWRIQGFSSLQLDHKLTTQVNISDFSVFLLCFNLTGASLEDATVNFQIHSEETNFQHLTLKISVLKDGKEMKCFERKCVFRNETREQNWDPPKFVSRKEILERTSDWLCGDDLNLFCKFFVVSQLVDSFIDNSYCGPTNLKIDIPRHKPSVNKNDVSTYIEVSSSATSQSGDNPDVSQHKSNSTAVLLDDFLTLYKDQTLFDFELRSGDVSFPVHKIILSARSPVFRAMFYGDMREADSTFQDLPDVDAHTLNRMLTFLYAGTVDDLQWEGAAKLYYAADKYQVLSLKQECSYILRSGLSVSNVSDILELADRHQDKEMTSFVHDFLLIHFDEVVLSDEWEKFVKRNGTFAGKSMMEVYKKNLQK